MPDTEESLRELRLLTRCRCEPPYALPSGFKDPDCLEEYQEDVQALADGFTELRARAERAEADLAQAQEALRQLAWAAVHMEAGVPDELAAHVEHAIDVLVFKP